MNARHRAFSRSSSFLVCAATLMRGAHASNFVVTTTSDSGAGSLRAAVTAANGAAGADTITFDPVVFSVPKVISLTTGQIGITDDLIIDGPPATLTISGGLSSRLFLVAAPTQSATFRDLVLILGTAGFASGGAIRAQSGNLTLDNCQFTFNDAGTDGGAIYSSASGAALSIHGCTFESNSADSRGGAIFVSSTAAITIDETSFHSNSAYSGGAFEVAQGGALSLTSCALTSNTATAGGGGVSLSGAYTSAAIVNSTLSDNDAGTNGGALALTAVFGSFRLWNCTIAYNQATGGEGGGIGCTSGGASIVLASTIVHGNVAAGVGDAIFTSGTVNAASSIVSTSAGVTTWNGDAFTNLHLGTNPGIGPLADNGGPTRTHALSPWSPAIDNGSNPAALSTDQRGVGFARVASTAADIGAFEDQFPCGSIVGYCTAGTTTNGCRAKITGGGTPSASAPSGFTISVATVEGNRSGLIFYGISGRAASNWGSGTSFMCVAAPTQRTGNQSSGGTEGGCDGAFTLDFNDYAATNPGALGSPFVAGQVVNAQAWFRDPPAPKTTNLSNGLEFTLCP